MADSPTTKLDHALLVADYPIKDWTTGKPKALVAKAGAEGGQYVITGTFAINSIGGFAASDGLIIHKKFQDSTGKVITEGNAVLPPDAQEIKLEGKAAEKVGGARIDAKIPENTTGNAPGKKPKKAKPAAAATASSRLASRGPIGRSPRSAPIAKSGLSRRRGLGRPWRLGGQLNLGERVFEIGTGLRRQREHRRVVERARHFAASSSRWCCGGASPDRTSTSTVVSALNDDGGGVTKSSARRSDKIDSR